jgi:type I restriction enzyme S subunit
METLQPKLRFPEFSGDWNEKNINEVLKIGSGRDYKHLDSGEIPVFGTGGLMTRVNDFLFDGETVCIGRKGTIDKPFYYNGKIWTVDTLFYTHSFNNSLPKFIYNQFQRINWREHSEASGVPSLSKSTIEKIKIKLASLEEQTKIANFLSAIDTKINQLTKKKNLLEQYKKGIMQKIFNQEIRFKDDNGNDFADWEEKKLGEICDVRDGTHDSPKYVDSGYPFITSKNLMKDGKIDFENVSYINETDYIKVNQRSKVNINDILFGMIGTIGNPVLVNRGGFAIKNVALLKEKECLKNFYLIHFLKGDSINQQFFEQNTGGTQKFVSLSIVRNLNISFPSIDEQTKIANFLSAIDENINQVSKQLEQTTQYKRGVLQQMFV